LHLDFNLIWYTVLHIHGLYIIQVLEFWREKSKIYTIMICKNNKKKIYRNKK
jgi:hypothetical protein